MLGQNSYAVISLFAEELNVRKTRRPKALDWKARVSTLQFLKAKDVGFIARAPIHDMAKAGVDPIYVPRRDLQSIILAQASPSYIKFRDDRCMIARFFEGSGGFVYVAVDAFLG